MNAQSTLIAYAKWDFKPKDAKEGGWLKFSKGDRISAVGYTFKDQWCWSGQTSKGKWGLFPASFVEDLQVEKSRLASSPGSVKSGGLGLRIGSIPLGRRKSSRSRPESTYGSGQLSGSPASAGGMGSAVNFQPGLEVVTSQSSQRSGSERPGSR